MKFTVPLLLASLTLAADVPTSWTPEFSFEFQTIGPVVPSPDGKLAAWTQSRAVMETEKSDVVSQVFLGPTVGGPRPLPSQPVRPALPNRPGMPPPRPSGPGRPQQFRPAGPRPQHSRREPPSARPQPIAMPEPPPISRKA